MHESINNFIHWYAVLNECKITLRIDLWNEERNDHHDNELDISKGNTE